MSEEIRESAQVEQPKPAKKRMDFLSFLLLLLFCGSSVMLFLTWALDMVIGQLRKLWFNL